MEKQRDGSHHHVLVLCASCCGAVVAVAENNIFRIVFGSIFSRESSGTCVGPSVEDGEVEVDAAAVDVTIMATVAP